MLNKEVIMRKIFLVGFLLFSAHLFSQESWSRDYAAALKSAKEQNKPLLIAFVGIDWCPWSKKLYQDVLSETAFTKALENQVVLVWVDFPDQYVKVKGLDQEYERLKSRYDIRQLPSLILATPDEKTMSVINYLPLNSTEFADYVKTSLCDYGQLSSQMQKIAGLGEDELEKMYRSAEKLKCEEYREQIMQVGLKSTPGLFFLLEKYAEVIEGNKKERSQAKPLREQIVARDPQNERGAMLKLAVIEFETIASHLKKKENPQLAIKPLLSYIETFGKKDQENLWKVEMMVAKYLFSKEKPSEALKHAQASYDVAPKEMKREISATLDFIKTSMNKD
jgi:thioredoxin-related protein